MSHDDLLSFIRQRPFIPFRLVTTDGTGYEIRHPEMLMPGRRTVIVGLPDNPQVAAFDRTVTVSRRRESMAAGANGWYDACRPFGGNAMTLPEFLTRDADGYIHVTGHRIGLQDLIYYYSEGYSPEALLETFPTLSLALVHKVIAFYLEDRVEVDAYLTMCEAEVERQRALAPRGPDAAELRRRLASKQASGA